MPWNASRPESEVRKELIDRNRINGVPMSVLCREYGISRKTAYKWIRREASGHGLENQSRRPKRFPGATPARVVDEIVAMRSKHKFLGGRKIGLILKKRGVDGVPSGTTITSILRDAGMLDPRACREAKRFVRFRKDAANDMWQADFKGHFPLRDGTRCHVLNVIDDCTRFCICCEPLPCETFGAVRPVFVKAFREYGMPASILCDNGNPWGKSVNGRGITGFERWLMELGVLTLHGRPLHPQTQGKEERFNKSFAREALRCCDLGDMETARAGFSAFRRFYNDERPHCALADRCPSELYHESERPYPESVADWEYPEEWPMRTVDSAGAVCFRGARIHLSCGMSGAKVAFAPARRDGAFNVIFRQFLIARYDFVARKYEFARPYLMDGDPRHSFPGL